MKRGLIGFLLVCGLAIAACSPTSEPVEEATTPSAPTASVTAPPDSNGPESSVAQAPSDTETQASVDIGSFTLNEIYDLGATGCGMTLWREEVHEAAPGERTFTLVNGIEDDSMLMKLNGEVIRFSRTEGSGAEFYGQYEEQTFQNEARDVTVQVSVETGEPGEIESVAIPAGTITVIMGGEEVTFPVMGDAGC